MSDDRTPWFLDDQAVRDVTDDAFGHDNVAEQIVRAATELKRPVTIGLIGGFGTGKTTIAHLAMARIEKNHSKKFHTVRVTIDRHSGSARSRNLVHAVGTELEAKQRISKDEFENALRPLKSAVTISSEAPQEAPIWSALKNKTTRRRVLIPAAAVLLALAVSVALGLFLEGRPSQTAWFAGTLAAVTGLGWLFDRIYRPWIVDLFKSARVEDSTPRAEASDDVERIFSSLIRAHHDRTGRGLIIFVDDVDRLDPDDVLEALRSIKTLQAVPRGNEPVFVIACDDQIVAQAIQMAEDAPSPLAGEPKDLRERKAQAAKSLLDKFFGLRIALAPHLHGDMRDYVNQVVPNDHPARRMVGARLDACLTIILHGVSDPRAVIRRLNYFFSALSLAASREDTANADRQRVQPGDITNHPELLARLVVLRVEFPDFYADVTSEHRLLEASSRFLVEETLDPVQLDVLRQSRWVDVIRDEDENEDPELKDGSNASQDQLKWPERHLGLRRYLLATAHRVRIYPPSLTPLIHMSHSVAGRLAGNQRFTSLFEAVRDGDAARTREELNDSPAEIHTYFATEIAEILTEARPIDAAAILAGAAAACESLESGQEVVADAAARLLFAHQSIRARPKDLLVFLEYAHSTLHAGLRKLLTASPEDQAPTERDEQMRLAAGYFISHREAEDLRPRLREYLADVAELAGWVQGREWMEVAETCAKRREFQFINEDLLPALLRLARRDPSVTEEEATRIMTLAQTTGVSVGAIAEDELLALTDGTDPTLNRVFVGLLALTEIELTASTAATLSASLHRPMPVEEATTALDLLGETPEVWAEGANDETDDGEEAGLANRVVSGVTAQFIEHRPALDGSVATFLRLSAELAKSDLSELIKTIVATAVDEETVQAHDLIAALADVLDILEDEDVISSCDTLLASLDESTTSLTVLQQRSLGYLPMLSQSEAGKAALGRAAEDWRNSLTASPSQRAAPLAAFNRLNDLYPEPIDNNANQILTQIEAAVRQAKQRSDQMAIVSVFPWPEEQLARVVSLLENHWDNIPEDLKPKAMHHAARSFEVGNPLPESIKAATVEAAIDFPETQAMSDALIEWEELSAADRRRVLLAGATLPALSVHLTEVDEEELVNLVYDAAHNGDPGAVLTALPEARLQTTAVTTLEGRIADGSPYPLARTRSIVSVLERDQVQTLVETSSNAIDSGEGDLIAATRTLTAVDREHTPFENADVENWIISLLTDDLSKELAHELAELLGDRRLPSNVDKQLGKINRHAKDAVATFRMVINGSNK